MSYTVEKIASNKVKLSFVESAESFDAAVEKAYLKDRSKINVPGFRKGKAPRKLIENMYGEGVFYDDAFELVAQPAYEEAIKAENLQVVDRPQVDVQQIGAGQELQYTLEVFVKPDVTLGEYKGVAVEKNVEEVTDEEGKVLELHVAEGDMGKVIGRQGRIAKEIRTIIKTVAQRTGEKVTVEIVD